VGEREKEGGKLVRERGLGERRGGKGKELKEGRVGGRGAGREGKGDCLKMWPGGTQNVARGPSHLKTALVHA